MWRVVTALNTIVVKIIIIRIKSFSCIEPKKIKIVNTSKLFQIRFGRQMRRYTVIKLEYNLREPSPGKRHSPVPELTNKWCLLVIAKGSTLLNCSVDDFSKVNETRVLSSSSERTRWSSDVPWKKKHISDYNSTRPRLWKLDRRFSLF